MTEQDNLPALGIATKALERIALYPQRRDDEIGLSGLRSVARSALAAIASQGGQQAAPCVICGSTEPYTGACGSEDQRALCKAKPKAAPSETVDGSEFFRLLNDFYMASCKSNVATESYAAVVSYVDGWHAAGIESERTAKHHAVQQAQIWSMEAKGQRATVVSILRHFDLPENDWEALRLITEHIAAMQHKLWCAEVNLDGAKEEIAELTARQAKPLSDGLLDAVGKLVKAKGRFHTEQNYVALVAAYDAIIVAQEKSHD